MHFCVHKIDDKSENVGTYTSNFKILTLNFPAISRKI